MRRLQVEGFETGWIDGFKMIGECSENRGIGCGGRQCLEVADRTDAIEWKWRGLGALTEFRVGQEGDVDGQPALTHFGPPDAIAAGITGGDVVRIINVQQAAGWCGDEFDAERELERSGESAGNAQSIVGSGSEADGEAVEAGPRCAHLVEEGKDLGAASAWGVEAADVGEASVFRHGEAGGGGG